MRVRGERGFTLIEVMMAGFILVTGVMGAVTLVNGANRTTSATKAREGGTNLARQLLESARSIPYAQLVPTGIAGQLQTQPGLSDTGAGAGWTIQRRGINFTIAAGVCSLDDPSDGTGPHDSGQFCADSAPAGTTDMNPDDYKRVTIDVSWSDQSGQKTVRQTTLIDNPGTAAGPAVSTPVMTSPAASPIVTNVSPATFTLNTTSAAATVDWSVDGTVIGQASGSGTSWSFSWALSNLTDGTYTVTAQAYDSDGQAGTSRSLSITLNRYAPVAPTGLNAGRNGSVVELEWLPNHERDIIGYHVYRVVPGGIDVKVCDTTQSNCQDLSPPNAASLSYYVKAVDLDQNRNPREGAASPQAAVTQTNNQPFPPTNLLGANNGTSTTLTWKVPNPQDPDPGDHIAFYRIYRDGVTYADRYDRTGLGTDTTYTDTRTGGMVHTYAITAVDTQLDESPLVGPISR